MITKFTTSLCVVATLGVFQSAPVQANIQDTAVTAETIATRLDVSARQRMLTQRMAKAFCFVDLGVNPEQNLQTLEETRETYVRAHTGFRDGDVELGLFVERKQLIINAWTDVDKTWQSLDTIYSASLTAGAASGENFEQAMDITMDILDQKYDFTGLIYRAYGKQLEGGVGNAVLVEMYDRQRMMSQQMSKELCMTVQGYQSDIKREGLSETLGIFDASLDAFINGLPDLGIPAAPTPEIKAQLEAAQAHWAPVREIAQAVADGQTPDQQTLKRFNASMDDFLSDMDTATKLLTQHMSG
ncbi:type IV pili methyl-accepting chemotaxis transducer N-terminal domain-containing protein [Pseudaestuariivita rosea]|uniref:type IV pili methyl-accepting chemotaxis transducer N-terminal domain-containing protein n=1 Tax=Pseudaestuariivita rosea TaxID=2763263 RepID=UPI001ABB1FAD|nr:type IV pili methyl-accepting chemotaxis transducer N-terminal domain-containing protein [Pseudaestuariivita rosea]